ncbi:MAG: DNA-protecting protein DprA [Chlorobiaceae bacterium]|nr:DNA-protecting protein DprA [Chlorobiaceae bacterium]
MIATPENDSRTLLLIMSQVPGLGPARINAIISHLGISMDILDATEGTFQQVPGIGVPLAKEIVSFLGSRQKRLAALEAAEKQLLELERYKATLLTITDPEYPGLLKEIADPPPYLFVRGTLPGNDEPGIAIVGTRRASPYGKQAAAMFSNELARKGFPIVSGLAYGIDIAAHMAAIGSGGKTIAVVATGVDTIYTDPRGKIWPGIVENGAIISEEWIGSNLVPAKFPKRNRIISGITLGTLVVESDRNGGSLITASFALEQNREVFAIPGSIYSHTSRGTNMLIQLGQAKAALCADDIISEVTPQSSRRNIAREEAVERPVQLSSEEEYLMKIMGKETMHIDSLAFKTGLDLSTRLVQLFELEMKQAVIQLPGQFFRNNHSGSE